MVYYIEKTYTLMPIKLEFKNIGKDDSKTVISKFFSELLGIQGKKIIKEFL